MAGKHELAARVDNLLKETADTWHELRRKEPDYNMSNLIRAMRAAGFNMRRDLGLSGSRDPGRRLSIGP
ncbi:MAG: hypothetical protein AAFV51_11425 [Pseudomonadota bacterium]